MSLRAHRSKTRYIAYVASSIDGKISLTKRTIPDWTSAEDWKFFQHSLRKADAVVVGRNTYLSAADRLRKRTTFVFTRRIKKLKRRGNVTFLNPNQITISDLFHHHKTVAVVGGGPVYQAMLDRGLIDELFLTIEPLVFGRGTEMFTGGTTTKRFQLVSVKKLNRSGTLLIHYKLDSENHESKTN